MEYIAKYALIGFVLMLAVIMVIVCVGQCFLKGKLLKTRLTLSLINVFGVCLVALFYDKYIIKNEVLLWIYYGYMCFNILILSIATLLIIQNSNQKTDYYLKFIESLNNTNWNVYFLCDKKDRIKDISDSFVIDLGLKKEDIIGRKAFDVFDQSIRFTKMNDIDITNKELRDYYKTFSHSSKEKEEYKREIYFQNHNGQTVIFNLIEKPIFASGKYRGRMSIGQKKTDASLTHVEQELVNRNQDLESIQYKFIAALELTEEGIFFNDLDQNYIWGNDILVKDLKLSSNTISFMDYKNLIYSEDLSIYTDILKNLTPEKPSYSITYRIKVGNKYEFVKESGKRIFEDENSNVILGFTKKISGNYFEKTNMLDVDLVKNFDDMLVDLDVLFDSHRVFQLVCVNLTSLPKINETCGRNVGNMIMNEYIKKIKNNFISESSNIYRASGLVYYFTMTDTRKMEFFKRGLTSDASSMNLSMHYGNMKADLCVNIGVAEATSDGLNKKELIANCNAAINASLNPNYRVNYAYFKDIKNIGINR